MNSLTPLTPEDPRLTAYALGELEGDERAAVETALAANPALRATVEEIRATAAQLTAALAAEPLPETARLEKAQWQMPAASPVAKIVRFPQAYYIVAGLAAAAFAVLVVRYEPRAQVMAGKDGQVEVALAPAPAGSGVNVAMGKKPDEPATVGMINAVVPVDAVAPAAAPTQLNKLAKIVPPAGDEKETLLAQVAANTKDKLEAGADAQRREQAFVPPPPAPLVASTAGEPLVLNAYKVQASPEAGVLGGASVSDGPHNFGVRREMMPGAKQSRADDFSAESYGLRRDNEFIAVANEPQSTFSIDVDTASYANVRRFLQGGNLPPRDAVRIEELVNYFPYRYAPPTGPSPFAASFEVASAPWEPRHRLVRIGLKGREVSLAARPAASLVFLLDVSGSMNAPNRLPLVKESMRLLVGRLRADDRVAIVTYAGKSGLALASTPVAQSREILAALDELQPSGSTNGGMGIQLAYDIAKANFIPGGVNRVILCTDGDFNVGVTGQGDLVRLIEEKAKANVFLTVLGFGMGNLKDGTLELLADKGNGNYGYIDSRREAEKLLAEQVGGTLMTIAKDVKIQVEFNPAQVSAYRLIGYENRLLKKEDFNNDKVDAGEIGSGHTVTALYEVIPAGADEPLPVSSVDELKYQATGDRRQVAARNPQSAIRNPQSSELLTVNIRYKEPAGDVSRKLEFPLVDGGAEFAAASGDFKFAAAVAGFGLALRAEPMKGALLADVARWAEAGITDDVGGYRAEFVGLVRQAEALAR